MSLKKDYEKMRAKHNAEQFEFIMKCVINLIDALPEGQKSVLEKRIFFNKGIESIRSRKRLLEIGQLIERSLNDIDPLLAKAADAINKK